MSGSCNTIPECQKRLGTLFEQLRTLEPPGPVPTPEAVKGCHAEAIPSPSDAPKLVHLRIKGTYPNHPSQICTPDVKQQPNVRPISFAKTKGEVITLAGVSVYGNGDDAKWFASESTAGFAYISLEPLTATDWKTAQTLCPDYSPLRDVTTSASRSGKWSEALEAVGQVTEAMTDLRGAKMPSAEEVKFPYTGRSTRYWGVCKEGRTEVAAVIVGGQPTHPPDEAPNNPAQCELGPWAQIYDYEDRPMVALDNSKDGFPSATTFFCVRATESEPSPFIQGAVDVADLRANGTVTLAHDAIDPRHIIRQYGEDSVDILRANSLFTVTLRHGKK